MQKLPNFAVPYLHKFLLLVAFLIGSLCGLLSVARGDFLLASSMKEPPKPHEIKIIANAPLHVNGLFPLCQHIQISSNLVLRFISDGKYSANFPQNAIKSASNRWIWTDGVMLLTNNQVLLWSASGNVMWLRSPAGNSCFLSLADSPPILVPESEYNWLFASKGPWERFVALPSPSADKIVYVVGFERRHPIGIHMQSLKWSKDSLAAMVTSGKPSGARPGWDSSSIALEPFDWGILVYEGDRLFYWRTWGRDHLQFLDEKGGAYMLTVDSDAR